MSILRLAGLVVATLALAQAPALVPVVSKTASRTVELPGELQPYLTVDVHARIAGYVERVLVDRGSYVKQGQLLAQLSAPELKAQIAEAESKIQAAESERAQAEAQLTAAQSTSDRLKKAAETPGAIAGNELVQAAFRVLGSIPGVTIYGPPAHERSAIVSFTVEGIHAHDVAAVLDREEGVAVRAGHHCAMPLHTKLGVDATTRASFHVYNLPSDLDRLGEGVRKAKQIFQR